MCTSYEYVYGAKHSKQHLSLKGRPQRRDEFNTDGKPLTVGPDPTESGDQWDENNTGKKSSTFLDLENFSTIFLCLQLYVKYLHVLLMKMIGDLHNSLTKAEVFYQS